MVVEIGLTAINTNKLRIETRPKRAVEEMEMAIEMEWKMVVFCVHELYENEQTLWDISMALVCSVLSIGLRKHAEHN